MEKIKIGIAGYGNLGRGVESALLQTEDMELVGVFTRRSPDSLCTQTGAPAYRMEDVPAMAEKMDVEQEERPAQLQTENG